MKKAVKIIIPVFLIIVLAFAFSACSYNPLNREGRNLRGNRNMVENTGNRDGYGRYNLFFANEGNNQLTTESRQYRRDWSRNPNSVKMAEEALDGLISGPQGRNLRSTVNPKARVNSVTLDNGVLAVDLKDGIIDGYNDLGTRSSLAANSIINSLRVLPGVREVRVTDNGRAINYNNRGNTGITRPDNQAAPERNTGLGRNNQVLPGRNAGLGRNNQAAPNTGLSRNSQVAPFGRNTFDGTVGKSSFGSAASKKYTSDSNAIKKSGTNKGFLTKDGSTEKNKNSKMTRQPKSVSVMAKVRPNSYARSRKDYGAPNYIRKGLSGRQKSLTPGVKNHNIPGNIRKNFTTRKYAVTPQQGYRRHLNNSRSYLSYPRTLPRSKRAG
ncbi:MAG: GerMN domain-containing protein [Clostridiales bacterium]|jgi:hypothetical protein|nr:GerMN domain-containing protein [Clostridiales bacterium]